MLSDGVTRTNLVTDSSVTIIQWKLLRIKFDLWVDNNLKTKIMKKKILFILCALLFMGTTYAQQYKQSDIDGIWLVTEGFNENTKQWVPCDGDDAQAWAFTSETLHGKPLALLSNDGGISTFTYTIKGNKILLCDIDDDTLVLVTIKIVSLESGHCFVGWVSTYNSQYTAKFKFTKIDEK